MYRLMLTARLEQQDLDAPCRKNDYGRFSLTLIPHKKCKLMGFPAIVSTLI